MKVVTPDSEFSWELDDDHRAKAEAGVKAVVARFPREVPQDPAVLAVLGPHCATCRSRPSCPQYHSLLWSGKGLMAARHRYDLAGIVKGITGSGEMLSVLIESAGAVMRRLDGVPASVWPDIQVGSRIGAFGVGCWESAGRSESPRNFFVFREDDPRSSAFESCLDVAEP